MNDCCGGGQCSCYACGGQWKSFAMLEAWHSSATFPSDWCWAVIARLTSKTWIHLLFADQFWHTGSRSTVQIDELGRQSLTSYASCEKILSLFCTCGTGRLPACFHSCLRMPRSTTLSWCCVAYSLQELEHHSWPFHWPGETKADSWGTPRSELSSRLHKPLWVMRVTAHWLLSFLTELSSFYLSGKY